MSVIFNSFAPFLAIFTPYSCYSRAVIPAFHPVISRYSRAVIPAFHPVIPAFHSVIPAFRAVTPAFHPVIPAKEACDQASHPKSSPNRNQRIPSPLMGEG